MMLSHNGLAPLSSIQEDLKAGKITLSAIVDEMCDQYQETAHLNAYVHFWADEAKSRAASLDASYQQGTRQMGKLWGVVVSIKDVISYQDHPVSAGSKMLQGYQPVYSATAVERLLAEDAIIIGITNCDEFAMGSDNRNSYYGAVSNALDEDRVPGGSSGGAAVSVQTGTCHIALGSDTGGSVRQPASFCNLIGFKPTYGRISRHGLIAYASSFDQIGLVGRHLEDLRMVFQVISGPDEWDSTALPTEADLPKKSTQRYAIIKETLTHEGLQAQIRSGFLEKITALRASGLQVDEVTLPQLPQVIPTYYVLTSAEASSNLSRYDGIRYGYRSPHAQSLYDMYARSRTDGFGDEVKRRILLGTFVLSVGYYDAYYGQAQKVRRIIRDQFAGWFQDYDAILLPTTPTTAWKKSDQLSPVSIYLSDIYSVLANLIGAPAISIPLGKESGGMPFGLQLIGPRQGDEQLIELASTL